MTVTKPTLEDEIALETEMSTSGIYRFLEKERVRAKRGRAADSGAAALMVRTAFHEVCAGVVEFFADMEAKRPQRRAQAYPYIKDLTPELITTVALKTAVSFLCRPGQTNVLVVAMADRIGFALENEMKVKLFRDAHPDLVSAVIRKLDKTTSHEEHRRRVVMAAMRSHNFVVSEWDSRTRVLVGLRILEIILLRSGMMYTSMITKGKTTPHVVNLTEEALTTMKESAEEFSKAFPVMAPMIVQPRPWDSSGVVGGYWTDLRNTPERLVRGTYTELVPSPVIEAVNTLQNTPWRINTQVLRVLQQVIYEKKDHLGVLPPSADLPIPDKPHDIATNEVARKAYRAAAAAAYGENTDRKIKRMMVYRSLGMAEQYEQYSEIFFPHSLDFRGRIYPLPLFLQPQGPDYVKALLCFATGKAIGSEQGPGWLAIHGANCFGVDKVALEDRITWVEEHEQQIRNVGKDPLQDLWWTEADSPWQFLAFCFEWSAYLAACDAGEGAVFLSSLPVMVDGSCNGIQHYSAMLRDSVGGAATNLVPADKPADIYGAVAAKVREHLVADTDAGCSVFSSAWLSYGIDRKITKRSVMVLPYGGTFSSCINYVREALHEKGPTPWHHDRDVERESTLYLAKVVWSSISEVVIGAREAMAWLQSMARIANANGVKTLRWRTPIGFLVSQRYRKPDCYMIETSFMGSLKVRLKGGQPGVEVDKSRNVSAFSPNFVHSLDASALMQTILTGWDNGVTHFAAVHDSYGTHAADMQTLAACLRHSFVQMYEENDVLQQLHDTFVTVLPPGTEVPPPPKKGTLDIREVLNSDFFFA